MSPGKCDDPVQHELLLVDSHNGAIREKRSEDENRIQAERARAHAIDDAETTNAIVGVINEVGYATHRGPKCRSYPSILTGATLTTCSN